MRRSFRLACAMLLFIPAYAFSQDEQGSTDTEMTKQPFGTMLTARLKTAPFPDDSRTTGYSTKGGVVPYEAHYDDNTVVFIIPAGFRPSSAVDFIVHFHGHKNDARRVVGKYKLGEQLEASGRNAILIVPQGPKDSADSGGGKLEKPGAFAAFIKESIEVLQAAKQLPRDAKPRNIILSAHSGGYRVLAFILDRGGLTPQIREAWLLDASYGNLDFIAAPFTVKTPARRLRSVFTDHLMPENVELMSYLSLKDVRFAVVEHDDLTSAGTSEAVFKQMRFHSSAAAPGKDELPSVLKKEPIFFMHTKLQHDQVPMGDKFFQKFAAESPFLNAGGKSPRSGDEPTGP